MLSHEQLYVLRRLARGRRVPEEAEDLAAELRESGLAAEKRGWLGWRLAPTEVGRQELLRARHSGDKVARAVASGLFDHVRFGLFTQIIGGGDAERFIDGQRTTQRLMMLYQIMRRGG